MAALYLSIYEKLQAPEIKWNCLSKDNRLATLRVMEMNVFQSNLMFLLYYEIC